MTNEKTRTLELKNDDLTAVRLAVTEVFVKWSDELAELDSRGADKSTTHYVFVSGMARQYGRILKRIMEAQELH